jgi:hypothetical protein
MKLKPLTQQDLDPKVLAGCGDPDCKSPHDKIFLKPDCHRESGTVVIYHLGGYLNMHCATCRRFVCAVAVAAQ